MRLRTNAPLPGVRSIARYLGCAAFVGLVACSEDASRLADGTAVAWSQRDGEYVAINYWAEWCDPCREEIPQLNALHHDRDATRLVILGVNYDRISGESLAALIDEMGIEFPVLVSDPSERFDYDVPTMLPTTVIIGPDATVHEILIGPQTRESLLHAAPESGRVRTRT